MPYKVFKRGDQWCTYTLDENNEPKGSPHGCFDSEAGAERQARALYANTKKESRPPNLREATGSQNCANCTFYQSGANDHGECRKYGDYGVDSDDVCDAWQGMMHTGSKAMSDNPFDKFAAWFNANFKEKKKPDPEEDPEEAKEDPKEEATETPAEEDAEEKKEPPEPKSPKMGKKELGGHLVTDSKGEKHLPTMVDGKPDPAHMGAAWAALHGGYRGNKYEGEGKQEAISKLKKMYADHGMQTPDENAMSKSVSKEFSPQFSIFKQADDTYRWIGVTSSGFRDRDKELVTSDALKADVLRMNKEQKFGELSWWHVMFAPENPPTADPGIALDIATCDASEMVGASNVESGVFYDNAVGKAFADKQNELGFSREFFFPASEPDAQGNYHRIHTYRRTILPAERASNLMSAETLSIQKETKEGKMSKLKELIGDEAYQKTLERVAQKEKELERAGVQKKENEGVDYSKFATKEEVQAIVKSLESISTTLTNFTTNFTASAQKEQNELKTQLSELNSKVSELYEDAPNFLKMQKKSANEREDTVNDESPAVKQAKQLAAKLKEMSSGANANEPLSGFTQFAMHDFSKNGS